MNETCKNCGRRHVDIGAPCSRAYVDESRPVERFRPVSRTAIVDGEPVDLADADAFRPGSRLHGLVTELPVEDRPMAEQRVTVEEAREDVDRVSKGGGDPSRRKLAAERLRRFVAQSAAVEEAAREVLADVDDHRWCNGPSPKTVCDLRAALGGKRP